MIVIPFIDAPAQSVSLVLKGRRCTFRFAYNVLAARWAMDLAIDATLRLNGRRLIVGVDLLAGYEFGLGHMFVGDHEGTGGDPDYDALISGRFRLYHLSEAEAETLLAA